MAECYHLEKNLAKDHIYGVRYIMFLIFFDLMIIVNFWSRCKSLNYRYMLNQQMIIRKYKKGRK